MLDKALELFGIIKSLSKHIVESILCYFTEAKGENGQIGGYCGKTAARCEPGKTYDHSDRASRPSAPCETMNALRSKGTLLVTNHDEPEAVIIPVAEYEDLMRLAAPSEAQAESALANVRRSFDERLSVLQGQSAATRLQSTIHGRAKLGGKVKAGSGYEWRSPSIRRGLLPI
jgi:PHD/YefM family antitoxin component YafN of YafNO toxin-antitoxin module